MSHPWHGRPLQDRAGSPFAANGAQQDGSSGGEAERAAGAGLRSNSAASTKGGGAGPTLELGNQGQEVLALHNKCVDVVPRRHARSRPSGLSPHPGPRPSTNAAIITEQS